MQLHRPLILSDAKTEGVTLTPTKKFFKPVLILEAPLTLENAAQLECAYLFDGRGNPHEFEGHHKLAGELPGADVEMAGRIVPTVTLKSERVAHIACFRTEKVGMTVQLRVHLPEDQEKLIKLLSFLSMLNKEGFTATITPAQGSLLGVSPEGPGPGDDATYRYPQLNEQGEYPIEAATKKPFTNKNIDVRLYSIQIEDGVYVGGWGANWKRKQAHGEPMAPDSPRFDQSAAAFRAAARQAHRWIQEQVHPKGVKEIGDHEAALVWLQDIEPELARPELLRARHQEGPIQ